MASQFMQMAIEGGSIVDPFPALRCLLSSYSTAIQLLRVLLVSSEVLKMLTMPAQSVCKLYIIVRAGKSFNLEAHFIVQILCTCQLTGSYFTNVPRSMYKNMSVILNLNDQESI